MKKTFIILICFIFLSVTLFSQEITEFNQDPKARYRLFRTTNIWNFIELNTATGQAYLIQYSIDDDDYAGSRPINLISLIGKDEKEIPGRFTLYATRNTYNFIMLDTFTGATYQLQWSFDAKNRFVLPISGSKDY